MGGHTEPDNIKVGYYKPLIFYRRQLHDSCPKKGNIRRRYGGTISLGLKKGTLVKHPKHGFCLIGGSLGERLSLSHLETNKRLCKNAKKEDLIILSNLKWNIK